MKKFAKALGVLSALALLGAGFVSCSDDDSDPEPSVKIAGGNSVKAGGTLELTATASDFSGDVTYAWESATTASATVKADATDSSKATVTGVAEGSSEITVTATSGTQKATAKVTVTVTAAGNGGSTATLWKFSDYATELGATTTSTAVGEAKTCGIVVMGKNVKIRSDGAGISGTITEGVTGYCQLSNGKDGALLLTVPAGTSKITLGAKNINGLKIVADDGSTVLKAFDAVENSNYANYEYEASFAAETKVYIGPFEASKTCNFKAIKLE